MGYQPKGRTHPRHRDREANACEARKEDVTGSYQENTVLRSYWGSGCGFLGETGLGSDNTDVVPWPSLEVVMLPSS